MFSRLLLESDAMAFTKSND